MKIAVIGGIGSGKSEVLKVARQMGIACLSADEINAELLSADEYIAQIQIAFPSAVVCGKVDKKRLAEIVFSDEKERHKLNAIAHPRILQKIKDVEKSPLVVEMPLLLESGAHMLFDEIVLVLAPTELRISRLESNRGMCREDAVRRMRTQADEKDLRAVATRVVDNDKDLETLRKNAKEAFQQILNTSDRINGG